MHKYSLAALGGTFDRFHKGHQTLLNHAFNISENIVVGITSDDFIIEKNLSQLIEPYPLRQRSVLEYAKAQDKKNRINTVKLHDVFGPTLDDGSIDCIVVSPLTRPGADFINQKRIEFGLTELPVEVCNLELSADKKAISSTRIRKGEINRQGFVYYSLLSKEFILNDKQKELVKIPFGKVYDELSKLQLSQNGLPVVSVGDRATRICLQAGFKIDFGVFDNLEKRQKVKYSVIDLISSNKIIKAHNLPGMVSLDFIAKLKMALSDGSFIEVEGEEDLAVIPLTLLLPLGSKIIYGQPNEGLVLVEVTEEKKEWVRILMSIKTL